MTDQQHTPEPWKVNPLDIGYERNSIFAPTTSNGQRHLVATVSAGRESVANARRIVACVNACAGIPTEKLEAVAFLSPHLPEGLKDKAIDYADLKQQRDRLMEALTKAAYAGVEGNETAEASYRAIIAEIEASK